MIKELEKFIDQLVNEKGLQNLDPETLKQVKKDLSDRIENRINAVILEKLPPEKIDEFDKLLDSAGEKEIQDFCSKNIPDLDKVIANELISFRITYLRP